MTNSKDRYDAVIIGFGKGGKTLAAKLAGAGRSVALIEQSKEMYGGTCINVGCIPTKSLVHSAYLAARTNRPGQAAYREAVARKDALTEKLRETNFQKLNQNPNVTIIDGEASFLSPHEILVRSGDNAQHVRAGQFFINTGSVPVILPIPGLSGNPFVYTSETLLARKELPASLAIIGGGYIGVEFASIYAGFGAQVTMIQDGPVFLPREDDEIAAAVYDYLTRLGVRILKETRIRAVSDNKTTAELIYCGGDGQTHTLQADAVLAATGRRPNTAALNLAAAGVRTDDRGGIITDESRTTSVPHIFAMGDVTGGPQFTYLSLDDCRIVCSKVLQDGSYTLKQRGAVPYSVFLDPPFSRVGMSEKEAVRAGFRIHTARLAAAAIPKSQVLEQPEGLLKAVIDADTGKILGAHLFCAESHELINLVKLAMDTGLHYTVLKNMIFTHPTMSEAFNDLFAAVH